MKIPLFDIDGTLVKNGDNLHTLMYSHTFKSDHDISAAPEDAGSISGKINNQIIVDLLKHHGINEEIIYEKINITSDAMDEYYLVNRHKSVLDVIPGVKNLLNNLKKNKIPIGLLTGNSERIAWIKMEKAGLREFFSFGAFGNMAFTRSDLVEIARKNA